MVQGSNPCAGTIKPYSKGGLRCSTEWRHPPQDSHSAAKGVAARVKGDPTPQERQGKDF